MCHHCGFPWPHRKTLIPPRTKYVIDAVRQIISQTYGRVTSSDDALRSHRNKSQGNKHSSKYTHIHQIQQKDISPQDNDSSEDEFISKCGVQSDSQMPKVTVMIHDMPLTINVDMGDSLDIICKATFHQLEEKRNIQLLLLIRCCSCFF